MAETETETERTVLDDPTEKPVSARWSQRGWGYVVLAAAFLSAFLLDGTESSFGILMPHLVKELDTDVALASFSGGLITGTALIIGPIVSRFIERFGCRVVALAGGAICFGSLVLSTLSVNILMFVVFYGICSGIGVGMAYMSYITVVNMYFDKRRSFAMGFVTSGSGLGLLSMAQLINFLITNYNWRGSYLIVAAIWGNLCAIALIMRPLRSSDAEQERSNPENVGTCHKHLLSDLDDKSDLLSGSLVVTKQDTVDVLLFSPSHNHHKASQPDSDKQYDTSSTDSDFPCDLDDAELIDFPVPVKQEDYQQDDNQTHDHDDSAFPAKVLSAASTYYPLKKDNHWDHLVDKDNQESPQYLEVMSPHRSLSTANSLSKKDLVNLPSECISSSILSLASVTSRHSKDIAPKPHHRIPTSHKAKGNTEMANELHDKKSYPSLLKNPVFLLFCYGAFSFQLAFNIGPMFAPSYALDLGLTADQASFTVSIMGICNMIGRFLAGLLSSLGFGNIRVYIVGTFLAGLVCFFITWCVTYISLILFAACYGLFLGVFFPLQSVLLVDILGIDQLPKSFGIICFCKSIACMLGPFLAGALYEMTQDYTVPFLFAGGVNIFASFTQLLMARLRQPCC